MKLSDAPQQWPADSTSRRPLAELIPAARNARTHSPAQVEQLAASMKTWGWTNPVLVDEAGVLIAGHGRVLAAQSLGWDEGAVMVAAGWTDAQKRAYAIADNQLAVNAGWAPEILALELDELRDMSFDLSLIGFEPGELNGLIGTSNTAPDSSPQLDGIEFRIVVRCADEQEQGALLTEMESRGHKCQLLMS